MVQVREGPETVGTHLEILRFFCHLVLQLVIRGVELLGHLIELACQIANLVISFNGHLVCEVTAPELCNPFAQPHDGLGKALAQEVSDTHADEQTDAGDAEGEPELLRNRRIQDSLWLLDHHAPLSTSQVEAGCEHAHSVFVDIVSLDKLQAWCVWVLHELLDQRTVGKGQSFEDEISVIGGNQLA